MFVVEYLNKYTNKWVPIHGHKNLTQEQAIRVFIEYMENFKQMDYRIQPVVELPNFLWFHV